MSKPMASGILSIAMILVMTASARAPQGTGEASHRVTKEQFEQWKKDLSNWGRWGKDDEIGTLNLITPAKRRAALALVKEGVPVSLSTNTAMEKAIDVPCPAEWAMLTATDTGATDRVAYPCIHGAAATHIDSLAHTFFAGKMWNGYDATTLVTIQNGAEKNSVMPM